MDTIDKLVMCAKSLPIHIEALPTYEEQLMEARAWQEKLEKTFLKKNSRYTLLEVCNLYFTFKCTFDNDKRMF